MLILLSSLHINQSNNRNLQDSTQTSNNRRRRNNNDSYSEDEEYDDTTSISSSNGYSGSSLANQFGGILEIVFGPDIPFEDVPKLGKYIEKAMHLDQLNNFRCLKVRRVL